MSRRNAELKNLHPVVREKVEILTQKLKDEGNPIRLFEGFRSPQRQAHLYSQGRTTSGSIKTKAKPWQSLHQYGVACDFVLYIDGNWSWETSGNYANYWNRYHELAREIGLKSLSWEKPHIQLESVSLQCLQKGNYPIGGDSGWAENLEDAIVGWSGYPVAAPPLPRDVPMRPPLGREINDESEDRNELLVNRYRINARRGLRLRGGPGTEYDVLEQLVNGRIVSCISTSGDWFQVDLEGDGSADGFCHSGFLVKLD